MQNKFTDPQYFFLLGDAYQLLRGAPQLLEDVFQLLGGALQLLGDGL